MRKLLIPLLFVCSRLTISAQTQILVLHHADKTGPNGNKIFLRSRTTQGNFWTGTWGGQTTHVAWTIFGHNSFQVSRTHCFLYMGLRIRAVCD